MGVKAIYRCNNCGRKFQACAGGGFCYDLYRCEKCDSTKTVNTRPSLLNGEFFTEQTEKAPGACKRCGGKMSQDLLPMCKACKSRDVEEIEITMYID